MKPLFLLLSVFSTLYVHAQYPEALHPNTTFSYKGRLTRTISGIGSQNDKTKVYAVTNYKISVTRFVRQGKLLYIQLSKAFGETINYKDPNMNIDPEELVFYNNKVYEVEYRMPFAAFKQKYLGKDGYLEKLLTNKDLLLADQNLFTTVLFDAKSNIACAVVDTFPVAVLDNYLHSGSNPTFCYAGTKTVSGAFGGKTKMYKSLEREGHFELIYYYSTRNFITRFSGYVIMGATFVKYDLLLDKINSARHSPVP
jgi:hypothetical protein